MTVFQSILSRSLRQRVRSGEGGGEMMGERKLSEQRPPIPSASTLDPSPTQLRITVGPPRN